MLKVPDISSAVVIGCGYVGSALADRLEQAAVTVTKVKRSNPELDAGVVCCDVNRPETLTSLPDTVDAVYYLVSADDRSDEAYERAYVSGLREVLRYYGSVTTPPKLFVYVSSTGVYGQDAGQMVDEASSADAESFTGRRVRQGELLTLSSGLEKRIIVRFGGIYGPGRTRMLGAASERSAISEADNAYTNRIHREDCAGVLMHLSALSAPESIYNAVDDDPALRSEVISWIAAQKGKTLSAPDFTEQPSGKRVSNRRLKLSGYTFEFPTFREGYRSLL